jgi:hypothetical protein
VPLHNFNLPPGTRIQFGKDFVLQEMPKRVVKDSVFQELSSHDRPVEGQGNSSRRDCISPLHVWLARVRTFNAKIETMRVLPMEVDAEPTVQMTYSYSVTV